MSNTTIFSKRPYIALGLIAAFLAIQGCSSNLALRQRAERHLKHQRYTKAELVLNQALKQEPEDWRAQFLFGVTQLKRDRPMDAQLWFERAEAAAPNHIRTANIRDGLAESLYRQKKYDQLKKVLAKPANENGDVRDYLRQARYLQQLGDPDGAEMALVKSATVARHDDPAPYLAMADFYKAIGVSDKSLRALRIAYGVAPEDPRVLGQLKANGLTPNPEFAMRPPNN